MYDSEVRLGRRLSVAEGPPAKSQQPGQCLRVCRLRVASSVFESSFSVTRSGSLATRSGSFYNNSCGRTLIPGQNLS